jgi:hypothetical protein
MAGGGGGAGAVGANGMELVIQAQVAQELLISGSHTQAVVVVVLVRAETGVLAGAGGGGAGGKGRLQAGLLVALIRWRWWWWSNGTLWSVATNAGGSGIVIVKYSIAKASGGTITMMEQIGFTPLHLQELLFLMRI